MSVDREVFDVHMKNIESNLTNLHRLVEKLFEKQEDMNVVLTNNTTIVNQHHARSNKLEKEFGNLSEVLSRLSECVARLEDKIKTVDDDLIPVKNHVTKINKTLSVYEGIPLAFKIVAGIVAFSLSMFGLVSAIKDFFQIK